MPGWGVESPLPPDPATSSPGWIARRRSANLRRLFPRDALTTTTQPTVDALVPLAVLEAMRGQDVPEPDGLDEYHVELATKRLGMSHTIEKQIARYADLAERQQRVGRDEVIGLLRLAARRRDPALLFADAGRRAGTLASRRVGTAARGVWWSAPGAARRLLGRRLARSVVREIFGLELQHEGQRASATAARPLSIDVTPDGAACSFYGSAVAAVLRAFSDFDGAVVHVACVSQGAEACRWETAASSGSES